MNRLSSRRIVKVALSAAVCLVSMLVAAGAALAETVTFQSTGAEQTFRVPAGVTSLHIVATGGKGGSAFASPKAPGFGATATGDLLVSPLQLLYVEVGGNGVSSTGFAGGAGGFNGGGNGGNTGDTTNNFKNGGGGGGGASDVRLVPRSAGNSLESRLITAGGGGGVGGGAEGGFGGSGSSIGLGEGGQSGGGVGGGSGGQGATTSAPGPGGGVGTGGTGGSSAALTTGGGGGGGGGGLFGGSGGVNGSGGGASGGGAGAGSSGFGSSVKNSSLAKDTSGVPTVVITYTAPPNNGGGTGGNAALETTIDAKPAKLIETRRERRKVKFRFSANKGGATFLCKLDSTAFAPCASPKGYRVSLGFHTFKVKAVGDTTPAVYSFQVKRKF